MAKPKNAVILANKAFGTLEGKTANSLVIYGGRLFKIVAVIDEDKAGQDAGEVLNIGRKGIPVVKNFEESLKYKPKVLIIGIAPPGGGLPVEWRAIIKSAIKNHLDIVSGLHYFFSDDPEFARLANRYKVKLHDLRKPPKGLRVAQGDVDKLKVPIVAIMSTDAASGKNIAILELIKEAESRGFKAGFVATGQTTMMLGGDAGACIDAIPADFVSGQIEKMVVDVAAMGKDVIFVEGQGSLSHRAYGQDALGVIYGCWPDATIIVHDPFRKGRDGFPQFGVPKPSEEAKLIETVCPKTKVVGIAINGYKRTDEEVRAAIRQVEQETGLPATDALRFGVKNLFDALLKRFEEVGKPLGRA
jgi:uncharacterized NAD-dependent epimerase/dehydratase family protein